MHDAASAWNNALLDNSARPSGALVDESRNGLPLGSPPIERLPPGLRPPRAGRVSRAG